MAVCLFATATLGQERLAIEREYACAAQPGPIPREAYAFPPSERVEELVQQIVGAVGLTARNIELRAADVASAIAYIDDISGRRYILYNEEFVSSMQRHTGTAWAWRAILAHELSHHLNGHLQIADAGKRKEEELEADRFAGDALARMDASREAVVNVFSGFSGGDGYPPTSARVAAAVSGWQSASGGGGEDHDNDKPVKCPDGLGGKMLCPSVECTTDSITMYGDLRCATKKAARYCSRTGRSALFDKEVGTQGKWPVVRYRCVSGG